MTPSLTKFKISDSNVLPAVKPVKAPVACFSANPTTGKSGMIVQFTDKSTNSPTSWRWDLGDRTKSLSEKSVMHVEKSQ